MEEMLKIQTTYGSNNITHQPSLAMHKSPHMISEFKPKIRIVHIFAPEIIKTDVANFRELVQRLTGKPTDRKGGKKRPRSVVSSSDEYSSRDEENLCKKPTKKVEFCEGLIRSTSSGYVVDQHHLRIKDEEEEVEDLWRDGGLGDIDGFIQGLTHEYPFLPNLTSSSSHLDVFGSADTYLNLAN